MLESAAQIVELDGETIGQIAAGEIIERPVSVVKELVENAVDAGAGRIAVALEGGGNELIEVSDDGAGMGAADMVLAVRRHATSKLRTAADLERIATLGFRGEGLASIAAVSRLEMITRSRDASIGARLEASGEEVGGVRSVAAPEGTRVRVSALFERVPVRREYLRSGSAEFNRVSAWLAGFALAYPQITFILRHDGRDVWVMPATSELRERLAMVFGRDATGALLRLDGEAATTLTGRLGGFISAPGSDRSDRRMQLLFVNGRFLRSQLMTGAWTAGYSTFSMIGRHAYGVVFLDLPPDQVDANVHPTKSDVRLRYGQQVFDALRRSIVTTLQNHASSRFTEHTAGPSAGVSAAPPTTAGSDASASLFEVADDVHQPVASKLRVLEQLDRTYIVATDGEGLLLVDQHAAHERIAYESIVERASRNAANESLLVPHLFELDGVSSTALQNSLETLCEGGLEIEPFGERTFRIVATPAGYRARPFDFAGFIDDLTENPKMRGVRERVWASLACHSVVVAGERLEREEMIALVERLASCANPMHCPHGRPTMIRLGPLEVARMFKRV